MDPDQVTPLLGFCSALPVSAHSLFGIVGGMDIETDMIALVPQTPSDILVPQEPSDILVPQTPVDIRIPDDKEFDAEIL